MAVIWSRRAAKSYLKEAEVFEKDVFAFVKTLSGNKMLCPPSKIVRLRRCVLSKQTSVVYKITGSNIILMTFVDNRSKHKY